MSRQTCAIVLAILGVGIIFAIVLGVSIGLRYGSTNGQEPNRKQSQNVNLESASSGNGDKPKEEHKNKQDQDRPVDGEQMHPGHMDISRKRSAFKRSRLGVVQSANAICSKIGMDILVGKFGSAVDAGIATMLCIGVTLPHGSGIGGGTFMTIYDKAKGKAEKSVSTLLAREVLPAAGHEKYYLNHSSLNGGTAVGVPGEVMGMRKAWEIYGRVPWSDLFQPAIKLCKDGFEILHSTNHIIEEEMEAIQRPDNDLRDLFVKDDGTLLKAGDVLKRPKLAETLTIISRDPYSFYNGTLAKDIVAELREKGSIISTADLRNYRARVRPPITGRLSSLGLNMHSPEPPSSGVVMQYILRILDGFRFNNESIRNSSVATETYQRIIEAFKFAFAKRSALGDPFFWNITQILNTMTSSDAIDAVRRMIDTTKTHDVRYYEPVFEVPDDVGTAQISVLAPDGTAFSATSSLNHHFGSDVVGSKTGIIYNNQMNDFSVPGTTNIFNISASESNFAKPGKMPMSSMSPSIFLTDSGEVVYISGGSGGPRIISGMAYVALHTIYMKQDLGTATDHPRLHHQLLPHSIEYEQGFDEDVLNKLQTLGHKIRLVGAVASKIGSIKNRCPDPESVNEDMCIEAVADYRKGSGAPYGY